MGRVVGGTAGIDERNATAEFLVRAADQSAVPDPDGIPGTLQVQRQAPALLELVGIGRVGGGDVVRNPHGVKRRVRLGHHKRDLTDRQVSRHDGPTRANAQQDSILELLQPEIAGLQRPGPAAAVLCRVFAPLTAAPC